MSATPLDLNPQNATTNMIIEMMKQNPCVSHKSVPNAIGLDSTILCGSNMSCAHQFEGEEMQCPKCASEEVKVDLVEQGQEPGLRGLDSRDKANNAARKMMAVLTSGVSNLAWKKREPSAILTTHNIPMGICQSCGNTWTIK